MNPFTVAQQVTPEDFIGRKTLITTAFTQLKSLGSLAIWGGTGMGKSSFLKLLMSPALWQQHGLDASQNVIVLLDCQSINPFKSSDFWRSILEEIKNNYTILTTEVDILLKQDKNSKNDLLNLSRSLKSQNKPLILLIDNYDIALRPNPQYTEADIQNFVSEFRTISNTERSISTIVTSSRRLSEIGPKLTPDGSPWFNQYVFRHIKPFTDVEVEALLSKSPRILPWRQRIRKMADGNPALLQNACYLLYEELNVGNTVNPRIFIQDFTRATLHLFQSIWDLSHDTEQTLLMLLALSTLEGRLGKNRYSIGGIEAILSQKEIELNNLVDRGILKQIELDGKINYIFCSSIMEWWVIKKIENSEEEELKKRQKVFLNLMSRQQTEKVMVAFRWLWQNKDKIASTVEQAGNLL